MNKSKRITRIVIAIIVLVIAVLPVVRNSETEVLSLESRKDAPGEFIDLPMGITHCQDVGADTSRTVLLVHGFSVPFYLWDPTFEALQKQGFRVIRFDLYGRGYSDRPDLIYDKDLFEKQISDLLDALEIKEPIDFVGASMGGAIVSEYAVKYPEKVNKLILVDPVHEPVNISILKLPLLGEYITNIYFAPSLPSKKMDDFYYPENHADWSEKFKVQMKYKGFKRALLSTLRNYMNEDKLPTYTKLGQLNKEVLLMWGEDDKTLPFEGNERIRKVVKCEFMSVKEAGHLPHLEYPELVNKRIIEFLNN